MKKFAVRTTMGTYQKITLLAIGALLLLAFSPTQIRAQERLCDTAFEDCRTPLWNLIDNETVGIDVAFWFMQDTSYANKIIAKHNQGVRVRILVDPRANPIYNGNGQVLDMFQAAGIPMRYNISEGILHWKMMLFAGQNKVEFSGANFSPAFFVPTTPNSNYIDEAIYFTDDPSLVNSFKTKYDDLWTNTIRYANYANISSPLTRIYPISPIDPELNWAPDSGDSEFANRSVYAYTAETQKIDVVMYRITDQRHTNAMIAAVQRGVPVRLLTEINEYRNPAKFWHSWNVDRMYMAGVQIKNRNPQRLGLNHEKAVMLYGQNLTIFGSSNWTTSSSNSQEEHNYFTRKQWFFDWFVNHFERKWNAPSENSPFVPQPPPNAPAYLSPQNGAPGLTSNVTLQWEGDLWAHRYDIYLGTTPNPPLLIAGVDTGSPYPGNPETYSVSGLSPGTTYYWRIVGKTMADLGTGGPTWSFTTAGSEAPPSAPTGLTSSAISSNQINLSWSDVATETGYRVERSPNGSSNWLEIATRSANENTYSDQQLSAQTTYFYRVRASNSGGFSGYSNTANATTPAPPPPTANDVVLWASEAPVRVGNWSVVADASAAGGARISNPDAGAPKKPQALANPPDYFEMSFSADAGVNYRIWLRAKAQNDFWGNDSVFVQFSDSVDSSGNPVYRVGTTSGAEVNLEDCSGCTIQGWGWQDNGWGVGVLGPLLRFQSTGAHTLRIQVKEDGLSIDQIVLSPQTYLNSSPGTLRNDTRILPKSGGGSPPAPTVSSISPTSGSTSGGTSISISGSNFVAGATVSIGGAAATNVNVASSSSITATTSARSAGTVNVTVTNPGGLNGTLTNGYTYVAPPPPPPTVSTVSPNSGPTSGGTSVTISGGNFQANASVTIGGTSATNVAIVNSTTITAVTPAHAAGAVDVVVTNTDGQGGTKVQGFTYLPPQSPVPLFDRVFIVVAENQSFGSVIGGVSMPYLNKLADRYGLAVNYFGNTHPSIGDYFWLTTGQNITNDSNFAGTVTADNIVRQLNLAGKTWKSYAQSLPSVGYTGGDQYPYVKRHNPFAYLSDVLENPAQANNLVPFTQFSTDLTNNQLPNYSFIIPNQQNNAHDCPAGIPNCTNADKLAAADNWLKTNIDPLVASAAFRQGGLLIITFDESVNSDTQNGGGHIATVVISSKAKQGFESTSLYQHQSALRVMAEGLGLTSFPGAAATAPNMAEFFGPTPNTAPIVESVSPTSGPVSGGTAISISGSGFATGASLTIGGSSAVANVVGSTTINTVTPAHASGAVNIVVTNPGGQSGTLTNGYVYASAPPPNVGGVTPNSGTTAGGTSITINGTAFATGATVTIGGAAATSVNVASSTTITATTPAHAAGTVNLVVTNPDGQSATLTNGFTFNTPSGETVLLADDFNDGAINASKWVANNLFSGFTDVTITVRETQRLEIGPLKQNLDGSHYNGIKSATSHNFVGGYAQVQIVQAPSAITAADAFFTIGLDVNNCYRLYVESGTLFFQTKINGVKNHPFTATFDPVNHAFWRLRHDSLTGNLIFETAPANGDLPGTWTQRYAETWSSAVPLGSMLFELKAGTWRSETNNPGTTIFDNFKAARP